MSNTMTCYPWTMSHLHTTYISSLDIYIDIHIVDTIFGYFETSERIVDSCYLSQSEGGVKYQKHSSSK